MFNYIENGDFSRDLEGWRSVDGHPEVMVKGEDGSRFAAFVANAQLAQRRYVAVPRRVKFSMRVEVEDGSDVISGGIQILIGFIDAGQLSVWAYAVREFSSWQTAEVDLNFGAGTEDVDLVVFLLVQPNFKEPVSITDIKVTDALRPFRSSSIEKLKAPEIPEGFTMPPAKA